MSEDNRNPSASLPQHKENKDFSCGEDLQIKDYAIASSINGIAIGGLDGVVTYINNAALRMWGS
ncbi:MAG TPA: hypothetical protein PLP82_06400, partial [Deltaproteobacteria bacterium]|nr:hypothetical protein [Deltaproteobacteria bacterium]